MWHTYIVDAVCKETPLQNDTEQLIRLVALPNDSTQGCALAIESLQSSEVIGSHLLGVNVQVRPLQSLIVHLKDRDPILT